MRGKNSKVYRTSLQSWLGTSPCNSEELKSMRAAVWHKYGVVVIPLKEVRDINSQNMLKAIAEKFYGQRRTEL